MTSHKEELYDTYISPNNIPMIKLKGTKWPWFVSCAGGEAEKFTQNCAVKKLNCGVKNW